MPRVENRRKPFIRMASDIGIENNIVDIGDGRFALPDGTDRFLLTRALIEQLLANLSGSPGGTGENNQCTGHTLHDYTYDPEINIINA